MQIDPIVNQVRAAVDQQVVLAAAGEEVEAAAGLLVSVLEPTLRQAVFDLAQQAAAEVSAQLGDRSVEVAVVEGDPVLRVTETTPPPVADDEDYEARITLRLPPSLKRLVEDAAGETGDSVNSWVVGTLTSRARRATTGGRVTGSFDL
ncbi:MAG: toxin-antitoxin system HicB family antitoxin [Acidimicrobiia bacterium]|jgi:hypothetical protein